MTSPETAWDNSRVIAVRGASEHNLNAVDVDIPHQALVTITGRSGSGKSSLAFDTVYREGQRRFLESLSSYARQYMGRMEKPALESISGLAPAVAIDQKTAGSNPRSTVGTLTEVYDFLRLLYARLGTPHCPRCGQQVIATTPGRMTDLALEEFAGERLCVMAPVVRGRKGHHRQILDDLRRGGTVRARIDGREVRLDADSEPLDRYVKHTIEAVVDRVDAISARRSRLMEAMETACRLSDGLVVLTAKGRAQRTLSTARSCPDCAVGLPEMEPRLFSFNGTEGACSSCGGLGSRWTAREDRVVVDPSATIAEGALKPMSREGRMAFTRMTLDAVDQVAQRYGFDVHTPWDQLTADQRHVILRGTSEDIEIEWTWVGKGHTSSGRDRRPVKGLLTAIEEAAQGPKRKAAERYLAFRPCDHCRGSRLNGFARGVLFRERSLADLVHLSIDDLASWLDTVELDDREDIVGQDIFRELHQRLHFLGDVGVGYLSLGRSGATLAGGEAQRLRLAAQLGAGLRGVLYVLDEPSIGLHPRDQARLIKALKRLRDRGNSVIVVEHDAATTLASDWVIEIGPGPGREGGRLVDEGHPALVMANGRGATARALRGEIGVQVPDQRRPTDGPMLVVRGARENNLKGIDAAFPLGCLTCVTGVSGSGKSSLVDMVLKRALAQSMQGALDLPGDHDRIEGAETLTAVVEIDQKPVGRTPRSNPATYSQVMGPIRDLFSSLPAARVRGYGKERFSFNVSASKGGGRCEACKGGGFIQVELQFLAPVTVACEECGGRRYTAETLEIEFKGSSIADVLESTVDEALQLFAAIPPIARTLGILSEVGLGYLPLGQPSTTLSGGEAQRVKLARELRKGRRGSTLYLLDEPTTGLHAADVERLVGALQRLVDAGHTVVVVEHDPDVIKVADHVLDLGPEGGEAGGHIVAQGTPESVSASPGSYTGKALASHLRATRRRPPSSKPKKALARRPSPQLVVRGARTHNLQSIDARIPHGSLCVVTGVSGSGKTSLALDTLFAEGRRRFVDSLSTYARRFLGRWERAPVDSISGLSPSIAIRADIGARSPRSTVATTTEVHDYLRVLYARIGIPHCPHCGALLQQWSASALARRIIADHDGEDAWILAPLWAKGERTDSSTELQRRRGLLRKEGFLRVLVDGKEHRLDEGRIPIPARSTPAVDLVIDRLSVAGSIRSRMVEAVEVAIRFGGGVVAVQTRRGTRRDWASHGGCTDCSFHLEGDLTPQGFSFNTHAGACPDCHGVGERHALDPALLVDRPDRSLGDGAMSSRPARQLVRRRGYYRRVWRKLFEQRGWDPDAAWSDLAPAARRLFLEGIGDRRVEVTFRSAKRGSERSWTFQARWPGAIRVLEEWYERGEQAPWAADLAELMDRRTCQGCDGRRLRPEALAVRVGGRGIAEVNAMTVHEALHAFRKLRLPKSDATVAERVIREIRGRLKVLDDVGLGTMSLDRQTSTLSGGEARRIRLAAALGSGLVGVLYVLDEPTVGLHPRDTGRLLDTLRGLQAHGNTVVLVEHDEDCIRAADWVLDIGPGAGRRGGRLVVQGSPERVARSRRSATGALLRGELRLERSGDRDPRPAEEWIEVTGAATHNLRDLTARFPTGCFTVVTGPSGAGKSSLVMHTLVPALQGKTGPWTSTTGLGTLERLVVVDQSPIGKTPASNPATATRVFTPMRRLFAETREARAKGFGPARFSFNRAEGRCPACEGRGALRIEMHFLADVWLTCEECRGRRYNEETLQILWKGRSIADVLDLEVGEALEFFGRVEEIRRPLQMLADVGLDYLPLGQPANTLSGGEAQRLRLATELQRRTGTRRDKHALLVLDEPTTGLHMQDVVQLTGVLQRLVDAGDTVIVVEHHMDMAAQADWVIDMGPDGGAKGGRIVSQGRPEHVARSRRSATAPFLASRLEVLQ